VTTISKNALIPYNTEKMYALVLDVNRYSEFLPWCAGSKVLMQTNDEIKGSITINHSGFKKSFTTLNRLQKNKIIEMRLIEGPFKRLEGIWRFDILADDCSKISLDLDFEFSNKLVGMALNPIFSQIANSMVDSFCKRAVSVYG